LKIKNKEIKAVNPIERNKKYKKDKIFLGKKNIEN